MMYYLYFLSSEVGFFNLFRYITFRTIWALLTALVVTIVVGPWFINMLHKLKFGQPIYHHVPEHGKKSGTPTMGGLLMGFGVSAATILWADLNNHYIWLCLFVFTGFGFIGFLDDWIKIKYKNNQGLSGKAKLLGQTAVSVAAMLFLMQEPAFSTKLSLPFIKFWTPDLGWFYLAFAVLVMVGASNGVNLTDGMDGLAIGPTITAAVCFAIFTYVAGNKLTANYLLVPYAPGVGETAVFCGAMVGAGLGFLWFNAYPAQVFMGDVGALSIGGALGFLAVLAKQELMLLIVGGIFVVESLSVIMQVGWFKYTGGKRIFLKAPLHHHFEMKGIPESKIIIRFWIMSILLGLAALSTLKLR